MKVSTVEEMRNLDKIAIENVNDELSESLSHFFHFCLSNKILSKLAEIE